MKRTIPAIGIILILLLSMLPLNISGIEKTSSTIIYVDDDNIDGPWDGSIEYPFKEIQNAIHSVSNGDTIFVFEGQYYSNSYIDKSIIVMGENKRKTCIKSIDISANHVKLTGFTIEKGISIESNSNMICNNNILLGIILDNAINNTISNNIVSNCIYGLRTMKSCSNNIIISNIIRNCTNDGLNIHGDNFQIINNTISNISSWGIYINKAENNSIIGNNLSDCKHPLILDTSSKNIVQYNKIIHNQYSGIVLTWSSDENIVHNNYIASNNNGIYVFFSENNSLSNNLFINNNVAINCSLHTFNNILYQNIFIKNEINAVDSEKNIWYNSELKMGNYWDDYQGTDNNNDGIGDIPYHITTNGSIQDLYPLMNQPDLNQPLIQLLHNQNTQYFIFVSIINPLLNQSQNQEVHYLLDGIQYDQFNKPIHISEGAHTIEYWTIDHNGNIEGTNTITFLLDNTPPTIEFQSPEPGLYLFGNKLLSLTNRTICYGKIPIAVHAYDEASGVKEVFFNIGNDSGYDSTSPYEYTYKGPAFGDVTITAYAEDNYGRISETIETTITCYNLGLL